MKIFTFTFLPLLLLSVSFTFVFPFEEQDGNGSSTLHKTKLVTGDSYDLYINNWDMPVGRNGILADVLIPLLQSPAGNFKIKLFFTPVDFL